MPVFPAARQIRDGAVIAADTPFTATVVEPDGPVQPFTVAVTE